MCVGVLVPAWTIQPCFTLQPVFAVSLYAFFSRQQGLSTLILAEGCLVGCQGVGSFFSRAQAELVLQKCYILLHTVFLLYVSCRCLHTDMTYMTVFYERLLESWATEACPGSLPRRSESQFNCPAIQPWQPSSHGISPIFEFLDGLIYTTK